MVTSRVQRSGSVHETEEYAAFISTLAQYHRDRGTNFEPQPKVGERRVDLLRLYDAVVHKGGYDQVSAEKLAWRKLGQEFNLGNSNPAALAFNLKTVYYKYLAAYEIRTFHDKEPPPRVILEDLTAKGGDLLNRTLENYKRPVSRESGNLANGNDPDSTDEGQSTPVHDRMDIDEPGSGGGRGRSLRQQPHPRVIFQPDTTPARQTRNASATTHSPQPAIMPSSRPHNPSSDPNSAMFNIQSWEGSKPPHPMTVQAVITPGNNLDRFKAMKLHQSQTQKPREDPKAPWHPPPRLAAFAGPNIYIRCLQAILCPLPNEQEFALHHLVKISHERGDKFKFQSFPGLAEGLVGKALEISSLFFNVKWELVYNKEHMVPPNCLNAATGTPDILARINHFPCIAPKDNMRSKEFTYHLERMNETGLVIRNMVMLEDNAQHLSTFPVVQDFLSIALNLPDDPLATEFLYYAIEIAEQLTPHWNFTPGHPLYLSLISLLNSNDRGIIMGAFRAINRISMELELTSNLTGVPMSTISHIFEWARLDDEEMVGSCLDFLYQYTAHPENVAEILKKLKVETELVPNLTRLLMYNARPFTKMYPSRNAPPQPQAPPPPAEIPPFPKELIDELAPLTEPERSTKWLQCCFEENEEQEITQIHLWQSYQANFGESSGPNNMMLQASEFIKRVSQTFNGASAQVIPGPQPRFIIKGIQPRKPTRNLQGKDFDRCMWVESGNPCGRYFTEPEAMYHHIADDHLQIPRDDQGNLQNTEAETPKYVCRWQGCIRWIEGEKRPGNVLTHTKLHICRPGVPKDALNAKPKEQVKTVVWMNTQTDAHGDPAGLPLNSVLILKNLARHTLKLEQSYNLMDRLFGQMKPRLENVLANNFALRRHMADLMQMIGRPVKPSSPQ